MKELNVVILGEFDFPQGMAGTKLIHHLLNGLREDHSVNVRVMVLRQSLDINPPSGVTGGSTYQTLFDGDPRMSGHLLIAHYLIRGGRALRKAFGPGRDNFLFVYDSPTPSILPLVRYARRLGFKIIFYIVEDHEALYRGGGLRQRVKRVLVRMIVSRVRSLADGLAVVSFSLGDKFRALTSGRVPVFYLPTLIDPERTAASGGPASSGPATLFYSGSFRDKDGLPFLLDAFDRLRTAGRDVRLVLTGAGSKTDRDSVLARIEDSPFKDRIEYRGYLKDEDYLQALGTADVLLMTRIDSAYANAGMPFKLAEFLSTGKPVIASRVSDVPRYLSDRVEAMLVEPGNAADIVLAAEYLLDHPEEAAAMGRRGRKKAVKAFAYKRNCLGLLEFMRGLR